jgi:molybdopterin-containing oxidoreductase family iron-sulfur binding subunit
MEQTRRTFLQIAGLSALGFAAHSALDAFAVAGPSDYIVDPKALKGKRWAMVVDVKKFIQSGPDALKRCVEACHSTHNVPDLGNPKEEVKWLWTEPFEHAFPEQSSEYLHDFTKEGLKGLPVLVLCNHCDNPPCVRVCPTKATFKREDGLVMMDMHRCIGCRYCMAGCPFGARSLNWRDPRQFIKTQNPDYPMRTRGVVEKCTFCEERLAIGLQPACVEACKNKELVFGDMGDPNSQVRQLLKTNFAVRRKPQLGTQPQVYYIV